jgi:CubicO group peptidase (beta-lactamase class C family)
MVSTYGLIDDMKTPRALAAEVPAGNGVGNARSLAKFYAALIGEVNGVRLLSPAMLDQALRPRTDAIGPPAQLAAIRGPSPQRFGLGFELPRTGLPFLGRGSFGHPGAGGRLGWANPQTGVALAYVCNNMLWDGASPDPRWTRWLPALVDAVGAPAMA